MSEVISTFQFTIRIDSLIRFGQINSSRFISWKKLAIQFVHAYL